MALDKKLTIYGGILLAISIVSFIITFILFSSHSLISLAFFGGLIFFILHQIASWWILYQFAITRRRMGNRLHMYNKWSVFITAGFGFVYLVLVQFIDLSFNEQLSPVFTVISLVLMAVYIFVQENNTNNFYYFNLHKKTNQSKKSLNQSVGILTTWMYINIIWLAISIDKPLTVFVFVFLILMLTQNGLAYTTYGQSKYWNFTYEMLYVVAFITVSLSTGFIVLKVLGFLLGLAFVIRQWLDLEYSKFSKIAGIAAAIVVGVFFFVNPFGIEFEIMDISGIIPVVSCGFIVVLALAYVVHEPRFMHKLMKK